MTENKIKIEYIGEGRIQAVHCGDITWATILSDAEVEALREYFQAERDKEFGWWRASPEFVVRLRDANPAITSRYVIVLNERLGITTTMREDYTNRSEYGMAARAYFDAHPAPKPWHDAKPGEAWLLKTDDAEESKVYVVGADGDFDGPTGIYPHRSGQITAGRRIWPAQDGDNDE